MLNRLCCLLQWRGSSVLRLHGSCTIVVEVVDVAKTTTLYRLMQLITARVWGVRCPTTTACYVVFGLDCVDTLHYTLYTIHYTL